MFWVFLMSFFNTDGCMVSSCKTSLVRLIINFAVLTIIILLLNNRKLPTAETESSQTNFFGNVQKSLHCFVLCCKNLDFLVQTGKDSNLKNLGLNPLNNLSGYSFQLHQLLHLNKKESPSSDKEDSQTLLSLVSFSDIVIYQLKDEIRIRPTLKTYSFPITHIAKKKSHLGGW